MLSTSLLNVASQQAESSLLHSSDPAVSPTFVCIRSFVVGEDVPKPRGEALSKAVELNQVKLNFCNLLIINN